MTDIQTEVERIKKELLEVITQHLRNNQLTVDQAQKLASDFLEILPINDQKDLLTKLQSLSNNYQEVREIYLKELQKINTLSRDDALNQMRAAIAQGNIEHAITVAHSMRQKG